MVISYVTKTGVEPERVPLSWTTPWRIFDSKSDVRRLNNAAMNADTDVEGFMNLCGTTVRINLLRPL